MGFSINQNIQSSGNIGPTADGRTGQIFNKQQEGLSADQLSKAEKTSVIGSPFADKIQAFDSPVSFEKTAYMQNVNHPKLEQPDSRIGDGNITPSLESSFKSVYGKHERTIILQDFGASFEFKLMEQIKAAGYTGSDDKQLLSSLINEYADWKKNGEEKAPAADKKALFYSAEKAAIAIVTEQYSLPPNWKPDANEASAWTPSAVIFQGKASSPLNEEKKNEVLQKFNERFEANIDKFSKFMMTVPLTDDEVELIKYAYKHPEDPGLKGVNRSIDPLKADAQVKMVQQIVSMVKADTAREIKELYRLPESWTVQSTDEISWTPAQIKGIDPMRLQRQVTFSMVGASIKDMEQTERTARNFLERIPEGHPDRLELTAFLVAISKAIQHLKEFLYYKQSKDAKSERDAAMMRLGMSKDQNDVRNLQMDNLREMHFKQKCMGSFGLAMKIITPILSTALIAVGAATSWMFGAGLLLIAAGALIGMAAVIFSIVDSQVNVTSKAFDLFDHVIGKMITDPVAKEIVKLVIIGIVLAAFALIALISPSIAGSAGSTITAQTSAQIIKQLIFQIAKQISLQMLMQIAMPSVSKVTMPFLKASGLVDKLAGLFKADKEKVAMGLEATLMILTTLVLMGVAIKAGKDMGEISKSTQKWGKELVPANTFEKIMKRLTATEQSEVKSFGNFIGRASDYLETLQVGVKAGSSFVRAAQSFEMAKILQIKGDLESAEQAIAGMISILSKLLNDMQNSLITEGQFITTLTGTQKKMFQDASHSINQLFSQA